MAIKIAGNIISFHNNNMGYSHIELTKEGSETTFFYKKGSLGDISIYDKVEIDVSSINLITELKVIRKTELDNFISTNKSSLMQICSIEKELSENRDPSKTFKGIGKFLKTEVTLATLAGINNINPRHRIGELLETFSSVVDGVACRDSYIDGMGMFDEQKIESLNKEDLALYIKGVTLNENSVILSNGDMRYPKDYPIEDLRGELIRGFYKGSKFIINQENGIDILQDEYLSNQTYLQDVYKVLATEKEQEVYKTFPTYCFLPTREVFSDGDISWEVSKETKWIGLSTDKKGLIAGGSAIELNAFDKTYEEWSAYFKRKGISEELAA